MQTYLLAWSSKRWDWQDLPEMSDSLKAGMSISIRWSCGKSKRLQIGDRGFLIRLGEKPKGIFASGTIVEGSHQDLHWDDKKAATGETSYFVQIQLDSLLNPNIDPILSLDILNSPPLSEMHWEIQMSGVHIPNNVAVELEKVWLAFSNKTSFSLPEEISDTEKLYEGAIHTISVNAYERNPEARRKCITHYSATCSVCGFNFEQTYGEIGRNYIQVHHLKQISEIGEEYQIDPVRDLRPVCPNCHAIIHRRKPAYTIDEVKEFLRRDSVII